MLTIKDRQIARAVPSPERGEDAIMIGDSTIHGQGMIALRTFYPGDVITKLTGPLVRGVHPRDEGPNWVGIGPATWIDPDAPIACLNHSCTPNAAFGRHRALFATEAIMPGDEIAIDYSTTECDPHWHMDCNCRAPQCRKRLYAIQYAFLDAETAPLASPLFRLIWRKRTEAMRRRSAFPQFQTVPESHSASNK
jgi:hypothetical protein